MQSRINARQRQCSATSSTSCSTWTTTLASSSAYVKKLNKSSHLGFVTEVPANALRLQNNRNSREMSSSSFFSTSSSRGFGAFRERKTHSSASIKACKLCNSNNKVLPPARLPAQTMKRVWIHQIATCLTRRCSGSAMTPASSCTIRGSH